MERRVARRVGSAGRDCLETSVEQGSAFTPMQLKHVGLVEMVAVYLIPTGRMPVAPLKQSASATRLGSKINLAQ